MSKKQKPPVIETCMRCGKEFELGRNGTIHGCDACTGAIRDGQGMVWFPFDNQLTVFNLETGEEEVILRPTERR